MEIRTQTDLYASYLLVPMEEKADYNKYSFRMLEKNKMKGVLSCKKRIENGKAYLSMDITGKKSLHQEYQEREMRFQELTELFQSLIKIMEELREYLLTEKMAVLEPEFIYRNMDDGKLFIAVIPWEREEPFPLRKLAEFLLEKVKPGDENAVAAAYYFYRGQSQPQFSIYQFMTVLEKENIISRQKESKKEVLSFTEEDSNYEEGICREEEIIEGKENAQEEKKYLWLCCMAGAFIISGLTFLPFLEKNQKLAGIGLAVALFILGIGMKFFPKEKDRESKKEQISNNMKLEEVEDTVFFDSIPSKEVLKVQWKEKNKKKEVEIRELPFTIGKKKEQVTLWLSDPSVSRLHCRIFEKEGKVVLMDLESTNGTYLNGIRLNPQEIQEIVKNDEILVGKVELLVV